MHVYNTVKTVKELRSICLNHCWYFLNVIFNVNSCGCIGVGAKISIVDISKPGQIKAKLCAQILDNPSD